MRKICFSLLLTLSALMAFNTSFARDPRRNNDSTFIYVYRVGQLSGAGANWAVFLDDQKICKLSNNKYMRLQVTPGKHKISAKVGGVGLMKKETEIEIDAEAGGSYFVACNVKSSITRFRLEMIEVTKSSANKQMEKMSLDKCQDEIEDKQGK
jgi:hypothetical protein